MPYTIYRYFNNGAPALVYSCILLPLFTNILSEITCIEVFSLCSFNLQCILEIVPTITDKHNSDFHDSIQMIKKLYH